MSRRALISEVLQEAAAFHKVGVQELLSERRTKAISLARWRAMWRFRSLLRADGSHRFSTPQIAAFVGLRDHASVLYGLKGYAQYLKDAGVDNTVSADEWAVDDIHKEPRVIPVHQQGLRNVTAQAGVA